MPLLAVLMLLPGCAIPQRRGALQGRDLPETFEGMTSEENSSQMGIDEFFNDPVLTSLIDEGLAGNLELKTLGEQIQIAENEVLRRRGSYMPFVWLGGGARLDKLGDFTLPGASLNDDPFRPGHYLPNPLPNFMFPTATLAWQVDIWRQLRNSRDAAALRFLGTTEGRNYVVTRLVAEIAENYYGLMALDKRLENLDMIIGLQEQSLEQAKAQKVGVRGTELGIQRFLAEVRKNQSQKLIVRQEIIQVENRINFLLGRYPQPVPRNSTKFYELELRALKLGLPSEILQNRPDVRQAEYELCAAELDISVARADFYPKLNLYAGVGYEAFNPKYLYWSPESLVYNVAGDLTGPLINKKAIQAEYKNMNAKQLQAVYNYQQTVLNAFTEVINRINMVENYRQSIEIKKEQLQSLERSVDVASDLFQATRVVYMDILFAQRDLVDARMVLIDTKREQLSAVVNTYQALGGGLVPFQYPDAGLIPSELPVPPSEDEDGRPTLIPPMPGSNEESQE